MGVCGSKQEQAGGSTAVSTGAVPSTKPAPAESEKKPAASAPVEATKVKPTGGSKKKFSEVYKLGKELGAGAFSVVKEGAKKGSDESYAIKVINKAKLSEIDEAALKDEISILESLNHENIIRLYDWFDEKEYYYLVTEKMMGGELFDRIVQKSYYNEKEARDTCVVLFNAIQYCHSKRIAHRDLKPENLLLLRADNDSNIKIADFGFAKICPRPASLSTQCGTPGYVAPEILMNKLYDTQVDMWSLGVIVYILLGGYPPFIEQNQTDLFRKIKQGKYEFHEEYWGQVSPEAKALITSLLTVDPAKRLTADDALKNKWVTLDDAVLTTQDLGVNLEKFRAFNAKRKLKAAVKAVIATNKLQSLGLDFKKNNQ